MEITFLGTSSMVPTSDRNHSAVLLKYKKENILIDCGEGTQRQFRIAKISPAKLTKLLISHWHGDHVLGIPGLMQTLIANHYTNKLEIYGPKGSKKNFKKMLEAFEIRGQMIDYEVIEVKEEKIFEDENFILEAYQLEHGNCLGYSFIEKDRFKIKKSYLKKIGLKSNPILKDLQKGKAITWKGKKIKVKDATSVVKGKKICFVADTKKCENIVRMCKGADLMISEATLMHDLVKVADERNHLTGVQAAELAKKAKVEKLILTHFSQRYKDVRALVAESKKVFKNVKAAKDFMKISV